MIPIQQWRARIGLFNVKCYSAGPRLNSAFRLEKLTIPSTAHSPKGDPSPIPSTIKHVPASSNHEHKGAFSAENSSSDESTTFFVSIKQQPSADRKDSSARTLGSKAVYSLLSSLNTDAMLYLPSDLLRDAVVMLLIAIVSQLLILSGDIETNPGPINIPLSVELLVKELKDVTNWYVFGVSLGIPISTLDAIKRECSDVGEQKIKMFQFWLQYKLDASWKMVIQALEQNNYLVLVATLNRKYLLPDSSDANEEEQEPLSSEANERVAEIRATAVVVERLRDLETSFTKMLTDLLDLFTECKCDLSKAKFFLDNQFGTVEFRQCADFDTLLRQLHTEHVDTFNTYHLRQLTACFNEDQLTERIGEYEAEKEAFLKETTVIEFQRAVVSRVEPVQPNQMKNLTIKISRKLAEKRTLKDIEELASKGFSECQLEFIRIQVKSGSVIISWFFPEALTGQLEYLACKNIAVFKDAGLEEMAISGKVVFSNTLEEMIYNDFYQRLVEAVSDEHTCQSLLTQLSYSILISDEKMAQLSSSKVTGSSFLKTLGLEEEPHLLVPLVSAMSRVEQTQKLANKMSAMMNQDELTHSIRSMQQPSASSSTDSEKGEQLEVPASLVKELADLRFAFTKLIHNYEKQLHNSPEAQEEFVEFLPRLFHRGVEDHSFQSNFNILVEEEVSLFNVFYLKQLCSIFPEDVRATTRQLVDEYEQQCQNFMSNATVSQFKQLFPATATSSKLLSDKVPVILNLENDKGSQTLEDLTKLVNKFGVSGEHLHLSNVGDSCIAVTWLCSTTELKQLKMAISDNADSFMSKGVLQVFVREEVVLNSSQSAKVRQLEGPSDDDLPQNTEVQTDELKTVPDSKSRKPVTTLHLIPQVTDIEYQCTVCFEVFGDAPTEPYLTDCGHHLCGKCCDHLLNTGKTECPNCRKPDMLTNARCDNYLQRLVKNLKVRCSEYEEGCEWDGELKDLQDHLKQKTCFVCPFGCGKYGSSSVMKEHIRHCHDRMISCENCGYYNTFTIVTEQHYPICPQSTPTAITPAAVSPQYLYNQAPLEFIIGDFSEKKQAIEQQLSVPFYTHNRGYKFHLNVHPNGIHDGSGSHLSVHAEPVRGEYDDELKQPFEGDIQIELLNRKEDKNHHSATICFNRHDHTVYRITSQDTATCLGQPDQFVSHTDLAPTTNPKYLLVDFLKLRVSVAVYSLRSLTPSWQMGPGERDVAPLSSHDDSAQPIIAQFTISEFSKRKEFNNMYFSPPFTTSPQGYKFSIKAMADGFSSGKGSHITLNAIIMKGQHDDHLKWPFIGTIIIEVLNWREDKRHHKQVYSIDHFTRVTEGEYGIDFGFFKFMSHASLPFNPSTNTQYLKDDCICVRVRKSHAADD